MLSKAGRGSNGNRRAIMQMLHHSSSQTGGSGFPASPVDSRMGRRSCGAAETTGLPQRTKVNCRTPPPPFQTAPAGPAIDLSIEIQAATAILSPLRATRTNLHFDPRRTNPHSIHFIPMDSPLQCPIVDSQRIHLLQQTIGEKLAPIVALYFKDCSENLKKLLDLIDAGESEEVGKLAHQMKGAALSLGLLELQELFRTVETSARNGKPLAHDVQSTMTEALERARSVMMQRYPEIASGSPP